jgi:serine/threonine-protein kinase
MNSKEAKVEEKPKTGLAKYLEENPKMKPAVYAGIVIGIILLCALIFVGSWKLTSKLLGIDSSTSQTTVSIPEVTSLTIDEAKKKLEELGVTYEVEEVYSNDVEFGKIISQKPSAGTSYDKSKNSPVRITMSKGVKVVKMPKIKGLKYDEAVAELEKYELVAEKVEETSQTVQEGIVIKQDVAENQDINAGTTVKVYVSIGTGLAKVTVPYVVDTDVEEAKKQLTDKKLEVNVTYQEDTNKSNGVVLKQSIDVGTVVEEGTAITLTVNKIQELKEGTINVYVKSITGYKEDQKTNTNTESGKETPKTTPKKVKVRISVDDEDVYKEDVLENTEVITHTIKAKGVVNIRVYVDEVRYANEQMDMNGSNTVLNVKK